MQRIFFNYLKFLITIDMTFVSKKLSITLFLMCSFIGFSQENVGIPPSPTVASLVTVQKDSVNNMGMTAHNIPIWEMRVGKQTFPISMYYSSSGVKVDEIPSYVGLGWNLSAGGTITRSVIDHPDDLMSPDHGDGILHTDIMSEIEQFHSNVNGGGYNETQASNFFKNEINESNLETRNDTQPDLFYFNIMGMQGRFIFNADKEVVSLVNDNYKFDYSLDGNGQLDSFTITDTNGNIYLFSDKEYSKTQYNSGMAWEYLSSRAKRQRQLDYYSAWHLTSITTPENLQLNFEYDSETIEYILDNGEMAKICIDQQCEDAGITNDDLYDYSNSTKLSTTDYEIDSKKISRIYSDSFNILFTNTSREDLNGGLKLDDISVKDPNNILVADFNFNYSYLLSPNAPSTNNFEYKRLMLGSIYKNGDLLQHYDYYDKFYLPHRKSREQDFWGYYNDNNATSLVPKVYVTLDGNFPRYHIFNPINENVVYQYGNVNRNVNSSKIHMGMLKEVTYSTGGIKTYNYEPNDFVLSNYSTNGEAIQGNGVRVKNIAYQTGDNVEYVEFDYRSPISGNSSGKLSYLPNFATHIPWNFTFSIVGNESTITNPFFSANIYHAEIPTYDQNGNFTGNVNCYYVGGSDTPDYGPSNQPQKYYGMTTRRYSHSQNSLSINSHTAPFVYEYVSFKEGSNGKKVYKYNVLGALGDPIPAEYDLDKLWFKPSYKT